MRSGLPVFTIERSCLVETSALRRPSGANRRDAACAVCIGCFSSCFLSGGHPERVREQNKGVAIFNIMGIVSRMSCHSGTPGKNGSLCLIWIVSFFRPQAKKAMRMETPPQWRLVSRPRPPPLGTSACSCFLRVSSHLVDSTLRCARLAVYALRNSGDIRRSASPSAPRSGVEHPAERQRLKKIVTIS